VLWQPSIQPDVGMIAEYINMWDGHPTKCPEDDFRENYYIPFQST
jgi:hypothetical protein